jgi:hypothetical protein
MQFTELLIVDGGADVKRAQFALTVFFMLAFAAVSAAAESGWKFPNLNPFSSEKSSSSAKPAPKKSSSGLKWPFSGESEQKPKKPSEPSTWDKVSTGTKEFFGKTKDTLMPWTKSDQKAGHDSVAKRYNVKKSAKKPEKKSFFTGWLSGEEEKPEKPKSVSEFLAQPRP